MACVSGKRQSFEEFETFVQNFQLCQSYSQLSLSFSNSFHFDFCIHKVIRKKRRRRRITLLSISYLSSLSLSLCFSKFRHSNSCVGHRVKKVWSVLCLQPGMWWRVVGRWHHVYSFILYQLGVKFSKSSFFFSYPVTGEIDLLLAKKRDKEKHMTELQWAKRERERRRA